MPSAEAAVTPQRLTFVFVGPDDLRERVPVPKYALEPLATEQLLEALPFVPCGGESVASVAPLVMPEEPDAVQALLACARVDGRLAARRPIPLDCEALDGTAQDCWQEVIQRLGLDEKARATYTLSFDQQAALPARRGLRVLSGGAADFSWRLSEVPHRPLTELLEGAQSIGTITRGNCGKLVVRSAQEEIKAHVRDDLKREAIGTLHGHLYYDCQLQRPFTVTLRAHPLISTAVQADENSVIAPPEALDDVVNEELPLIGVYHSHLIEDAAKVRVAAISPTDKRLIRHRLASAWQGSLIINVAGPEDANTAYMYYSWQRGEIVAEPGLAVLDDDVADKVLQPGSQLASAHCQSS